MKAKAVNEIQNFKRGQDPHQALELGENNLDFVYNKTRRSLAEIGVSILSEWDDAELHDFDLDWNNRPTISFNTESKVWSITDNKERNERFETFDELLKYFIINHVGKPQDLENYLINHQDELDEFTNKKQRLINNLNKMKSILNEEGVHENIDFKRGHNPHKTLEIGEERPITELVEEAIKQQNNEHSNISFQELRDFVYENYEEQHPIDIVKDKHKILLELDMEELMIYLGSPDTQWAELQEVLSKMPAEYQIKWWLGWLP